MPKCTWRDHPGSPENCNTAPDAGQPYCPRHTFMAELAAKKKDVRDQVKANGYGKNPKDRMELLRRGFHFVGSSECSGCNKRIEWWDTPKGKKAPYNAMPLDTSPALSHFVTCTNANHFRRTA